jgi:hypothetical protein
VRHVRMLGLCLVAALAVAAVGASSAVAGPQWVKCELVGPGHNYTGPNCTKAEKAKPKGSGEYELYKAPEVEAKRVAEGKSPGIPFTGASVGSGGLLYTEFGECNQEVAPFEHFPFRYTRAACEAKGAVRVHNGGGPAVECTGENSSGEASGKNQVTGIHVTFTGCLLLGFTPCENAGPEEIKTNELKGKLGYISKANKEVGVLLEPAAGKHSAFAEFACPGFGLSTVVGVGNKKEGAVHTTSGCDQACPGTLPEEEKHGGYDGVISPITPVNEMTSTFTQEYKVEWTGSDEQCIENLPNHLENKHIDVLETYSYLIEEPTTSIMWSCGGEEITNVNTPEEAGEIKA